MLKVPRQYEFGHDFDAETRRCRACGLPRIDLDFNARLPDHEAGPLVCRGMLGEKARFGPSPIADAFGVWMRTELLRQHLERLPR